MLNSVRPKVLIVEDEAVVSFLIESELDDFGCDVVGPVATVGLALLAIAAAPDLDAALLDVQLSGERSFPVADALIAQGVPFAFMTGYSPEIIWGNRYRAVPVLTKPFKFNDLEALLIQLLRPAESA